LARESRSSILKKGSFPRLPSMTRSLIFLGLLGSAFAGAPLAKVYATAPWNATFDVVLDGQTGKEHASFVVQVHPEWAPEGAKRFQDVVDSGILREARFFRVVPNFMAQFGIPGSPEVAAQWHVKTIPDDPVKRSNTRGMMTFATAGPNTRTTQMFINFKDNSFLDGQGFAPFAEVMGDGMKVVDRIQSKYREQPQQGAIQQSGNAYLTADFPELSYVANISSSFAANEPKAAVRQVGALRAHVAKGF